MAATRDDPDTPRPAATAEKLTDPPMYEAHKQAATYAHRAVLASSEGSSLLHINKEWFGVQVLVQVALYRYLDTFQPSAPNFCPNRANATKVPTMVANAATENATVVVLATLSSL
jgi:hypothetical protein